MRILLASLALLMVAAMPLAARATSSPVAHGYIRKVGSGTITYGQPAQIADIRSVLTYICTGGKHLAGLGPAVADELIQVENYAIAEGSCGNPELHVILHRTNWHWSRLQMTCPVKADGTPNYNCLMADNCSIGGGVTADYGPDGLYHTLVAGCRIPKSIVNRIIAVRSSLPYMKAMDKRALAVDRDCARNSQSHFSCPNRKMTASERRGSANARYILMMTIATNAGDFKNALRFAKDVVSTEAPGMHSWDSQVPELQRINALLAERKITRSQAIAMFKHFEQTGH